MTDHLETRLAELRTFAGESGFDPEAVLEDAPDDPVARVFLLAVRLGLDPLAALQADVPRERLEEASRPRRQAAELLERQRTASGIIQFPSPWSGGGGGIWISPTGGVAGGPGSVQFVEDFLVVNAHMPGSPRPGMPGLSLLVMQTQTSYDQWGHVSPVFVNDQQIGLVTPNKPTTQFAWWQTISIVFPSTLFAGPTSVNTLRITPSYPNDWIGVGTWWIHYHQDASTALRG